MYRKDIKCVADIKSNSDYDSLVYEYRDDNTSSRRRDTIIQIIAEKYMPKIKRKSIGIPARDIDDYFQVYYKRLIESIWVWEGRALFTTYLFGSCIIGVLNEFLIENRKKESAAQVILCGDFEGMDEETINTAYGA